MKAKQNWFGVNHYNPNDNEGGSILCVEYVTQGDKRTTHRSKRLTKKAARKLKSIHKAFGRRSWIEKAGDSSLELSA